MSNNISTNFDGFDNYKSSSIILGNSVNINAGNLDNYGKIFAKDVLSIKTTGDINNKGGNQGTIQSLGNLSLLAGGSIANIGATIKSGNNLSLLAGGSILNQALVDYKINGVNATPSFAKENILANSFPLNKGNINATEDQALTSNANNIRSEIEL